MIFIADWLIVNMGQKIYYHLEVHMSVWQMVVLAIIIIGAINWLLVGLFRFDLVAAIAGRRFGETNAINRLIYIIVGICGLIAITIFFI
jgi:uncharacterized membrane protein YuzA (DUF378 family)